MTRPLSIDTRWIKSYRTRPFEDSDEAIYVATWDDGRVTEHFTIPRDWQDVFVASIHARLQGVDAALAEVGKPLCVLPVEQDQQSSEAA